MPVDRSIPVHNYRPDPETGRCLDCYRPVSRPPGTCLWCGHHTGVHGGRVDPVVLAHYAIVNAAGEAIGSRVKWSTRACSLPHCACRRYER